MEIRRLAESDSRASFRSGNPDLDRFFIMYAGQNQFRHHIGATYVAVEDRRILAYATVAAAQIEHAKLPAELRRKLPAYPLPALRLGRLAVDETSQGRGIGRRLLRHVFLLAVKMSEDVGCIGILVDAKRDARDFYSRL